MGLDAYRHKRDFAATPEPAGDEPAPDRSTDGGRFVIQKHAARREHYDFRLELDGVLKSWAVPKGPSLDPEDKRLAVEVEDHPVEYGDFEGVIPPGQYGGGTVLLWDRGRWRPEGDPRAGLAKGHLHFHLEGERLRGAWNLIRMAPRAGEDEHGWLLVKIDDEAARHGRDARIVETATSSVATGRPMELIAAEKDRVWHAAAPELDASTLPDARRAPLPEQASFQLATLVETIPIGDGWLHEIKFDGYRAFLFVDQGRVRIVTRGAQDWTHRFQILVPDAQALPVRTALIDGEVIVFTPDGKTSFQALQQALGERPEALRFQAFDLLHLDGWDVTAAPLADRKALLRAVLEGLPRGGRIGYSDHVEGLGEAFYTQSCRHHLEGVMSKRADAPYRGGRGRGWVKTKCGRRQEVVIGGFTEPRGTRKGLGALLVGVYEPDGRLRYAGKVGTGFTDASLATLRARLEALEQADSPFDQVPPAIRRAALHFVRPDLLAEVAFTEWTRDGALRHPSFQGLREDKRPRAVRREEPVPVREVESEAPPPLQRAAEPEPRPARRRRGGPPLGGERPTGELLRLAETALTHPDKVLFPEEGLTKRDLARYCASVAPVLFAHAADRPLMLLRCPNGRAGPCFHQKHADAPGGGLRTLDTGDGEASFCLSDPAGLVALVQMGALELHLWGSRAADLERPDRIVFDLDPDLEVPWGRVAEAALEMRDRLTALELRSFALLTGGKGVHVVVPVTPGLDWDATKAFTRAVAEERVRRAPRQYTAALSKASRKGRIFIDYLRNGRGATAIAPFSTRARIGAPVAVPVGWEELGRGASPPVFTLADAAARVADGPDPWADYFEVRQAITAAARRAVAP